MLSEDLPFRRANARFDAKFPQSVSNLVMVVEADTPEGARDAAHDLAGRLEARPDLYAYVRVPRAEPFLEAHAFYYLDPKDLDDLADRLVQVQPFLGRLTRDPSLRGLFEMLARALEERAKGGAFDVTPLVLEVDRAVSAARQGAPYRTSWQSLMRGKQEPENDRRQFVLARAGLDFESLYPARRAIATARALFRETARELVARSHGLAAAPRLRVTGGLAMEHEELETVTRGIEWLGLASFVLVGVILGVGLRSGRLVLASLATLVVGLALTAAFAALTVGHLNLISVAFGVLYIGLGVDYAIHFSLGYRDALAEGRSNLDAITEAAADVGRPLFLCAATTALGFYAFVPTAYRGVSELGWISGSSMFIGLAVTLTVLPALLHALPLPPGRARSRPSAPGRIARLADVPVRHPVAVVSGALVLGVVAAALLPFIRFDLNPVDLRDPDTESVSTFRDLLATSPTPPWSVTVLADDAAAATELKRRLSALPTTDRVVTIDSFVPDADDQQRTRGVLEDLSLAMGPGLLTLAPKAAPSFEAQRAAVADARQEDDRWLSTDAGRNDAAARALASDLAGLERALDHPGAAALLQRLEASLLDTMPENLDRLEKALGAQAFTADDLPAALVARWRSPGPGARWRVEAFPARDLDDIDALRSFVQSAQSIAPEATGAPVMIVESGYAIVRAFFEALALSAGACTLVLLLLLRRPGAVLLVLSPLVYAALLTGGATVLLGVPFNFANVIALPLLFGIGVDGGIHVVHRARSAPRGENPIRTSTGRAVVFSALTTIGSFGNLAFSQHPGTASMGLLLTVGVLAVLLATLVLLPALLALRDRRVGRA